MDEREDFDAPTEEPEVPPQEEAPNPLKKEIEDWKARAARIEEIAARASAAAAALSSQQQNVYQNPQRSAYVEPEEEVDFDPMDRKALSREIDRRAQRIANNIAAQYQQQIQSSYQQNDARFALIQRGQTYEELKRLGMEDLAPEVDEYIRDAQITPQYLSDPRAWETLAATVLGKRKLKEARESAGRAPLLGSAGGRSPSSVPVASGGFRSGLIDDGDAPKVAKYGLDMEEADFFLRGPVGISDFEAFQAKRAARGKR